MNKFRSAIERIRIVPAIGFGALVFTVTYLATNYPDTKLQDGVTFEEDGTAVAGREFGDGWIDIRCSTSGKMIVEVVDRNWVAEDRKILNHDACDNKRLDAGDISQAELWEIIDA